MGFDPWCMTFKLCMLLELPNLPCCHDLTFCRLLKVKNVPKTISSHFWPRLNLFLARSIILLSCSSSGGTLIPFEYGWSYQKNSNACNFVFLHRFIHKKFRLVRGPVFYPVSGFHTSDGPIEKISFETLLIWLITLYIFSDLLRGHSSEKDFQACLL